MVETFTCTACSAPVGPEEIAQGLAVKVSGRLLCPQCLDRLPGDAQVLVNQMRALRGMAVTTYRFFSGRHPGLTLYTFTTAAMLLGHRHKLAHGETFEAPPLPPPGSRPRLPTAAEAARGERTGWIAVVGVAILVITGIVWLAIPAGAPKPPPPVPIAPVAPDKPPSVLPARNPAGELADLRRRLREHPEEAEAIANAAEILGSGLPPRELALRDGAEALAREALAVAEARRPKPLPEPPQEPTPEPAPAPKAPEPNPEPIAPLPIPVVPDPVAVVPDPAPVVSDPVPVPPVADPPVTAPPEVVEKPVKPPKASKPEKLPDAEVCEVTQAVPKGAKPVIEPGTVPKDKELLQFWPWPSGVPIHAPALDGKLKPKRLAMEVRLPGVGAEGGAAIVVHPGRFERSQLTAYWTDGVASTPPQAVVLSGHRWQTVAIPAVGIGALNQADLRLRFEDVKELTADRPFLVAGASTRSAGAPLPSDHPPGLPLLWPASLEATDGWKTFRTAMKKQTGKLTEERQFAFAKAKVLLPFNNQGNKFRPALRDELTVLLKTEKPANGNPDDLPWKHADFPSGLAGWPADGMGDLASYPVLAFGWRATPWGAESDLGTRLNNLFGKMLTADKRLRRPAVVPVLIIGEIDSATADEGKAIDDFWLEQAKGYAAKGLPVIDLRSAQQATGTEQIQRRAAMLLADGLRQLDWVNKL